MARTYRPAHEDQTSIILHIFSTEDESEELKFVTDSNVQLCGTLRLDINSRGTVATVTAFRKDVELVRTGRVKEEYSG